MIPSVLMRVWSAVIDRLGARRLALLSLLVAALYGAARGLAVAVDELSLWGLLVLAVISMLVGWRLAMMVVPGWGAGFLITLSGLLVTLLRVGRLRELVAEFVREWAALAWGLGRWLSDGPLPNPLPAVLARRELVSGLNALWTRTSAWVVAVVRGESLFDPVAVVLVWSVVVWCTSAWAGWTVRRHGQPVRALLPIGVLVAAILSYARGETTGLLIMMGSILMLLAAVGYDSRVRRWEARGMDFAELGQGAAVAAVTLSLLLTVLAAWLPSISVDRIVETIRDLTARRSDDVEDVASSLGVERGPGEGEVSLFDNSLYLDLPRRHAIGPGPELSDEVVMIVRTGDLSPGPPDLVISGPLPRYYWRSHTFDRYGIAGWYAGDLTAETFEGGEAISEDGLQGRRRVRQEVEMVGEIRGPLYAAGTLLASDHEYRVAWRTHDDVFGATTEASHYLADSSMSIATEGELRAAGTDYPQWILNRYLVLPDTVPERVLSLARDMTATEATPYDRAEAIESYLRTYPYSLDVPKPPVNRDPVDYFLFELQTGYCDYYATAMVVMSRAAGLPARIVMGYSSGYYDSYQAEYVVTENNAHAWAEIYFPGYGWVEFEPTAGQAAIDRSERGEGEVTWREPVGTLQAAPPWWREMGWQWWLWGGAIAALPLLVIAIRRVLDGWRLRRMSPQAAVHTLYRRLWRDGRLMAVPVRIGDTPYEFGGSFSTHLEGLGRRKRLLGPAGEDLQELIDLYVRVIYGGQAPEVGEQARAIRAWRRFRWRLWLARLGQRRSNARNRRVRTVLERFLRRAPE